MLDKELILQEAEELLTGKGKTEAEFLRTAIPSIVNFIKAQTPDYWKNYGMYWYNLQELIKQYDPRGYRELCDKIGGEEFFAVDEPIRKQFDYGTDMYNYIAASLYLQLRFAYNRIGNETHDLYDPNAGENVQYIPGQGILS